MGVQGLRKLIESSGCAKQLSRTAPGAAQAAIASASSSSRRRSLHQEQELEQQQEHAEEETTLLTADHVLCDMNCIIHQSFSRTHPDAQTTIRCVLQTLDNLLNKTIRARRSLLLCFDGPAPIAKLATQRQRRRKVSHLDVANNQNFSDLSITTGSVFMLELEQHVTAFLREQISPSASSSPLARTDNISVSGSSVPGEGEAKIASGLSRVAATLARSENDSVVVIGNDIDLVLTCIGATSFHNIGVLNPQTMQVIDVGSFLARWVTVDTSGVLGQSSNNHSNGNDDDGDDDDYQQQQHQQQQEAEQEYRSNNTLNIHNSNSLGFVSFQNLPGARIDFVWLFMLNGSDYYDGLGDVALSLWKRYRMLKRERPEFRLVSKTHQLITSSLRLLFQCEQITVDESEKEGGKNSKPRRRGRGGDADVVDGDDSDFDDEKPTADSKHAAGGIAASLSPEQRQASIGLMHASLWSLITTVTGNCPNFRFRPVDPKQLEEATYVTTASVRATVATHHSQMIQFKVPKQFAEQAANTAATSGAAAAQTAAPWQMNLADVLDPNGPLSPLTPLQTYCALMPRLDLLPAPIRTVFSKSETMVKAWNSGGRDLPDVIRKAFRSIDVNQLSPAERFLTQFGDPVDVKGGFYRGHPNHGVARKDAQGNRKFAVDFFRFAYAGGGGKSKHHGHHQNDPQQQAAATTTVMFPKVAQDLVPGAAKLNEVSAAVQRLTKEQRHAALSQLRQQKGEQLQALDRMVARAAMKGRSSKVKAKALAAKRREKIEQRFAVAAAAVTKKVHANNQQQQQQQNSHGGSKDTSRRQLYWYDVFSKQYKSE